MLIINPDTYRTFIKPLLFRLSPETAQSLSHIALKQRQIWRAAEPLLNVDNSRLEVDLAGMRINNPVGLAAGYDKDCESLPSLASLGFGYLTCGTVTELPRAGNPSPRVLRYESDEALVNSLGFPSKGVEHTATRLEQALPLLNGTPVVASVSGVAPDEILRCHQRLEPLASAIEVNISSPNTLGLRIFQQSETLRQLLLGLNDQRSKPLFIKLPPYLVTPSIGSEQKDMVLSLVNVCAEQGVEAVTVSNTWPVRDSRLAVGAGGLSGKPVFADMLQMVADIRAETGSSMAINACGGIFSGADALAAIQAGATTVQILTSLVYRGPGIVRRINEQMLSLMDREHMPALTY
ncbi:MAG: dihydroorotate dehydrogenase 2 [Chloroflexi bacterium]|nr:dihydroorotate dehydrogenase 2 [Chloroflexota bacterium]